jgi:hypothetical protein
MDSNEQNSTETGMSNPNFDGRARTSAANGALGGRPRIRLDHGQWERPFFEGRFNKDIADKLGISIRTLQRRKRQRQLNECPM